MKAVTRKKYGPPDNLEVLEIPKPVPKDNEVLVRVYATTINRTDCAIVTGKPYIMRLFIGLFKPKRLVTGTDFAGQIEAIGNGVKSFDIGDKVFGFYDEGLQSQAEYMIISETGNVMTMPNSTTFEIAAASLEGGHYAYNFINKVNIESDQNILINGTTGAIGTAMIQLLKQHNIRVTAVCNTKNIALIKSLGADRIIDYTKEDFTKDQEKYDFIFDAVGKSTFGKCKPLLKKGGVYISSELGPWVQNPFLAMFTPFFGSKKVKFPLPTNILKSMQIIKNRMGEGKFKPVIDRTYPIEKVTEAYTYVASGQKTGNVLLSLS